MSLLRPIQTRYKGHRFRSRTEARWAVAFDAARIDWGFEVEGYGLDLMPGAAYLPDFEIDGGAMYGEVKGKSPTFDELLRCRALSIGTGKPVLLLIGQPNRCTYWIINEGDSTSAKTFLEDGSAIRVADWCPWTGRGHNADLSLFPNPVPVDGFRDQMDGPVEAAASARFEHGESGAA